MSKGSGKTQTVTQDNRPWENAQPHILAILGRGSNLSQGSGITPQLDHVQGLMYDRALSGSPLTGAAQGHAQKTLSGGYLNPYASGAMGDAMDMAKSKINAQFSGDNFGSSAHQEWLGRGLTTAALPFASQMFENERGRQMQAAGMAPGLAMNDFTDLSQGMNVAQMRADDPWTQLQRYQQAVSSANGGGTSTTQQPLYSNSTAQTLGTLGMLGTIFGPSIMASDVRLKTDIKKVGERKDGLNVYEFRYKGEPQKHVGLMAQEVLMTKPEAVHDVGGLLCVDYSKVGE